MVIQDSICVRDNYFVLTMVTIFSETLRFYPPSPLTDRTCTIDYKIPGTDYTVAKGSGIMIPIMAIHHDPEIYPDPETFNPERFSPENKHKINPYTFLSFGAGGRNCIGELELVNIER